MLLNYLKLSLRLLARNPFFTLINFLGLSVGVAIFFLLWQYSQFELQSDQFHQDYQRIVRSGVIVKSIDESGEAVKPIGCQHLEVARRMMEDFAEIEEMTRIINQENFRFGMIPFHTGDIVVSFQDRNQEKTGFRETKVAYADPNLFTFFSLPLLRGSAKHVLVQPYSTVLSERTAKKYFGNEEAIGKVLTINDSLNLVVTGVFKDLPHNTHLDFELVISTLTLGPSIFEMNTKNIAGHCYFKLKRAEDIVSLEAKINNAQEKYWGELNRQMGIEKGQEGYLFLQPLEEIPFSVYHADYFTPKSKITLTVFALVGFVILIMAWINYLNLTISLNHRRIKEFAARKTLGAKPTDLTAQFLVESIVINSLALLFAFTLVQLVRQPLEVYLGFYIPDWRETSPQSLLIILTCVVTGIIFTGIYPALLTYRHSPKSLFRTYSETGHKNAIGQWLTVTQYASAAILIIWTFTIVLQLNFMLNKDIGIRKDNVVVIDLPLKTDYTSERLESFTHQFGQNKDVVDYAISRSVAGDDPVIDVWLRSKGKYNIEGGGYTNGGVDERFLPFYGINLLAGRNFVSNTPAEESNILVDMNAITFLGLRDPREAIGKEVMLQDKWPNDVWYPVKIIGVIETFSLRPLSQRLFIRSGEKEANVLTYKHLRKEDVPKKVSVRISSGSTQEVMRSLERSFRSSFPDEVFQWYFLDEHINRHYVRDAYARNQIMFMTGLAIFIACLGLLGMMTNQVTLKTKELGIRKVLGAQVHQLGVVLLKSSVYQVMFSIGIALPVAYFLVTEHLNNFMERITLQWWHFALPVGILIMIMFLTIASVLWKAANGNPVEALKYE